MRENPFQIQLKNALDRYEESVYKTDSHFSELKTYGAHSAAEPYLHKYPLQFLLDHLEKDNMSIHAERQEFERINSQLRSLEETRGDQFREKQLAELLHRARGYHGFICFFLDIEPLDLEFMNDVLGRDHLEILLMELKKDTNIHDIETGVRALDNALHCLFKRRIKEVLQVYPDIDIPYYPPSFWWRHTGEILKAKEHSSYPGASKR